MTDEKPRRGAGQAQGGYWYARAIKDSDLPSPSRLVALVLATEADNTTGQVVVSLSVISSSSGLSKRAVMTHLTNLEKEGFLRRRRPQTWQSLGRGEMTKYTLLIPHGYSTKSVPTVSEPRAPRALPRAGGALPLGHMSAEPRAGDAHTTTGLSGAAPPPAGADADDPAELPAPSPDEEVTAPRQYRCLACGVEASLADIALNKECRCGHIHTHEEHFPEEIAS